MKIRRLGGLAEGSLGTAAGVQAVPRILRIVGITYPLEDLGHFVLVERKLLQTARHLWVNCLQRLTHRQVAVAYHTHTRTHQRARGGVRSRPSAAVLALSRSLFLWAEIVQRTY